jgi:DNA-binding LytR/AlgR family response regulator
VKTARPSALIADDEPLLRSTLKRLLAAAWPELDIVAEARNGREALALFEAAKPDVCFLDIHMPGITGIEAARSIGRRAHVVFVTAYDQYAVQAFEQGALDYLVKPIEPERLSGTVARLRERLRASTAAPDIEALVEQLASRIRGENGREPLRWIHASVGPDLRLIAVDDIDFIRSDDKYTLVAWRGEGGRPAEALIRTPLKELLDQLDPGQFLQVHRSVVVNRHSISHVTRGENETAMLHLKTRGDVLPVSRSYLHYFRQM